MQIYFNLLQKTYLLCYVRIFHLECVVQLKSLENKPSDYFVGSSIFGYSLFRLLEQVFIDDVTLAN
jgi:hypothetical protein